VSRRLTYLLLPCLWSLIGCQDPEILITAMREKGYRGGVHLRVCDPKPVQQICTPEYDLFKAIAEDEEEVLESEAAVFFDNPPDPFEVDLLLRQQGGLDPSGPPGTPAGNQCNLLLLDLDDQPRPFRFTITFHAASPPSDDCREEAVCQKVRTCLY
jgi:hypothetical protein